MKQMRVFARGGLNLREDHTLQSHVIRLLADDEKVQAYDEEFTDYSRKWVKVLTSKGEVGWVAEIFLIAEPNPPIIMLNVPYKSQEDQDARHFRNDCGTVCADMVLEFEGHEPISSDDLSRMTSLAINDSGLFPIEICNLFEKFEVKATVVDADIEILKKKLEERKPVIALIWYSAIISRQSNYGGGHFVVVVGYGDNEVYVNDPDFYGNRRKEGEKFRVPLKQWLKAQRQFVILE